MPRLALTAAALLALSWAASARPDAASSAAGTYRLTGSARVEAAPFPPRDEELHADAVLTPGAAPGEARLALAVDTFRCELRATVDAQGALAFAAGQRCPVALTDLGEGRFDATLRSGSGAVRGGALELTLVFDLSGRLRLRTGGALDAVGDVLQLPGTGGRWTDVSGQARGRAAGRRDASRAGGGSRPAP